ncbi:hypothetical protein B0A48_16179 [Cryoendolithus antarcticus]|uniref:chitinase n=1 Tax=Cryoendolithus antarcticus TaxID=1507870 RepID=A0A1V8SFC9_9PEZI|nr:hypothetical protein B0A48_16179 [Cryoendolithus antarcticus]
MESVPAKRHQLYRFLGVLMALICTLLAFAVGHPGSETRLHPRHSNVVPPVWSLKRPAQLFARDGAASAPPTQQNPQVAPPLPIIALSDSYISSANGNSSLQRRDAEKCGPGNPCADKSQIVTDGFTHLYFAFAGFDPTSYTIVPGTAGDTQLYTEFTALEKSKNLKTWIAIGGFDFSDPGSTRTAWSNMTATSAGRGAFISSLKSFMSQYGFSGVDLDWEYPGTPERGGQRADTENYVSLVKEMRASFGSQYGISLTLAPDYWYLRGFDAKAMESSVDFFGFMAYDLHGFWDSDIKSLGAVVRGQTDIRDISNDTLPLWFDALDPSKINFGLAYYGRGYTLADPTCNTLGCRFSGPSKPGICTNYAGVMSLIEIEHLIAQKSLTPKLLDQALMKQITWDDQVSEDFASRCGHVSVLARTDIILLWQWIGYDDADTVKLKKAWADGQCFGGTMVWSVDFNSGSGSPAPVTTRPFSMAHALGLTASTVSATDPYVWLPAAQGMAALTADAQIPRNVFRLVVSVNTASTAYAKDLAAPRKAAQVLTATQARVLARGSIVSALVVVAKAATILQAPVMAQTVR